MILLDDSVFTLSPWKPLAFTAILWPSTTLSPPNLLGRTIDVNNWPLKDINSELLDKSAEGDYRPCGWEKNVCTQKENNPVPVMELSDFAGSLCPLWL